MSLYLSDRFLYDLPTTPLTWQRVDTFQRVTVNTVWCCYLKHLCELLQWQASDVFRLEQLVTL